MACPPLADEAGHTPPPRANRAVRTSRRLPDAQSLHLAPRKTARSFPGVPLALRFSSRSLCASFLAAAQSDPRRGASCYCDYLSPADLASLSLAGSKPQSVLASAASAGSAGRAGFPAAGFFHHAVPIVHTGADFLLADGYLLFRCSCLYFTGFDDLWQVPSGPGSLRFRKAVQF